MSGARAGYVRERPSPFSVPEQEVARRWWALPPGCLLPLQDGSFYRLLFAGRQGGACGPDVRDAVLMPYPWSVADVWEPDARRRVGDVEFHVRAGDWEAHGHQYDLRYNNVILHVVLFCDASTFTSRQDGQQIPLFSLADLTTSSMTITAHSGALWPCQRLLPRLSDEERASILRHAGLLRFELKTSAFVEQLRTPRPDLISNAFDKYDCCLIPALAEGSGYGRDRDFFRAAGLHLLGADTPIPEPLGRSSQPSPLDARRLRSLSYLLEMWRSCGAWRTIQPLLAVSSARTGQLQALRTLFVGAGLSLARADILIVNVILPFAAAVALLENDSVLYSEAEKLYIAHPGLPSNTIIRMMCRQLRLERHPTGSCQQQGLHYIYQQSCREKQCARCMMSKKDI
ncbi:hypothetical protein KSF_028250 [Reticulibacter mediterranei]|uniref:DUF2851 domain-containing protein n=1 Tax=Reticulibacter mediterranei TaxID=2778369 RepID=A0A8J3N350_9CHLR|nr:DUF2851 family protein [Reticulibacter mediterranei]GHO92777.1 hypothetical protein KSF_028250 [Reticulibacter mediterranei]